MTQAANHPPGVICDPANLEGFCLLFGVRLVRVGVSHGHSHGKFAPLKVREQRERISTRCIYTDLPLILIQFKVFQSCADRCPSLPFWGGGGAADGRAGGGAPKT